MKMKTRELTLVGIFAALTAIGAFIRVPSPTVPFTLQFLFCAYAGLLLGSKKGFYSQIAYVGLGLIGFPIFANGGGLLYVLQPTFGYLLGFILCAYIIGKLTEELEEVTVRRVLGPVLLGLCSLYFVGLIYLFIILNFYLGKAMSISSVLAIGFFPYIVPDLILSIVVAITSVHIIPQMKKLKLL